MGLGRRDRKASLKVERFQQGLRCQDVHAGLRGVDPNSAPLAHLVDTRLVGMAATLAASIRGREVITDAHTLKVVAAEQLDVDPMAFDQLVGLLDDAGLVHSVEKKGGKVRSFAEAVPFHQDLYERLGEVWQDRAPTEVEQQLLAVVDGLSASPLPREEVVDRLGLDNEAFPQLLEIGTKSDLLKSVGSPNGEILYSPFLGFENPEVIAEVFSKHGSDQFQEEFAEARKYQGLPVNSSKYPALLDSIARGLVMAPTVERPDGVEQPFAAVPYSVDRTFFTVRKSVLDKALSILACIRCGENFGGASAISNPVWILNALLDPDRDYTLGPHSSARRQYKPLFRMQIVQFIPSGNWARTKLIPTEDNLEAVRLARDLIRYGEPLDERLGSEKDARALLEMEGVYRTPIQTVHERRDQIRMSDRMYERAMEALMGRQAL